MPFDRRDVLEQKELLAESFEDIAWEVPRLLEAMWDAPDFYFDRVAQIHMDRWSDGRVVLVGDAAFCPSPMAGLGTSMAMVGSYVLAGELAAAHGDHRRAFASYESAIRSYATGGQKLAKGNAVGLIPRSRGQIRMRNLFIRMLPHLPWKGLVTGGVQKVANAVELVDYAANERSSVLPAD